MHTTEPNGHLWLMPNISEKVNYTVLLVYQIYLNMILNLFTKLQQIGDYRHFLSGVPSIQRTTKEIIHYTIPSAN